MEPENPESLARLVEVVRRLLGPGGCPWDREQTLESMRPYVLEEAHEVVDAIDSGTMEAVREELGDQLFLVVFLTELAGARGGFGLREVVEGIAAKMTKRHPWVFGDAGASDAGAAIAGWEAMKAKEKTERGTLSGVPIALPALLRAHRVGEKAGAMGYDWPDAASVRAKVDEELAELDEALAHDDAAAIEAELGDVLFALASLARKRGIDAESALRGTLDRFSQRFRHAELAASASGRRLPELTDAERDALWEAAKRATRSSGSSR